MGLSAQPEIQVRFENGFGKLAMISDSTSLICCSSHPINTASSKASSQISFISIKFSFRTLIFSDHPTGEPSESSQVGSSLVFSVGDSISSGSYFLFPVLYAIYHLAGSLSNVSGILNTYLFFT